jgi:hypothetical protein
MYLRALASTTSARMIAVAEGVSMSTQQKSFDLAGVNNAAGKPLEPQITEPAIVALFNVIVTALACMALVFILGNWYDTHKPLKTDTVFYECTFDLGTSYLTRKCEVLGKWVED